MLTKILDRKPDLFPLRGGRGRGYLGKWRRPESCKSALKNSRRAEELPEVKFSLPIKRDLSRSTL
ncbi:MAG: hypothetical protein PHG89_10605 [Gallionella sp.]|nr:hypothetical protein [Gallionella sp.]